MLIYHQAQDINHCVYRQLSILENTDHDKMTIDVYRLIDFYCIFPHLLKEIKPLPRSISKLRSALSDVEEPFESLRNTKRILHELENLQSIAIQSLLAKKLLDREAFDKGYLKRSDENIPDLLLDSIGSSKFTDTEWFKVLVNDFPNANFFGRGGLKARTGMMEYRYDLEKE